MTLCRLKDLKLLGPNKYSAAPDGGWGWAVAAAFFLVEIFTYGTIKIFGIFLLDLMKEFEESNSRVSWIVSIAVFVMTFNGETSWMCILKQKQTSDRCAHCRSSRLRDDKPLRLPVCGHGWRIAHLLWYHRHRLHHLRQSDIPHVWFSCR